MGPQDASRAASAKDLGVPLLGEGRPRTLRGAACSESAGRRPTASVHTRTRWTPSAGGPPKPPPRLSSATTFGRYGAQTLWTPDARRPDAPGTPPMLGTLWQARLGIGDTRRLSLAPGRPFQRYNVEMLERSGAVTLRRSGAVTLERSGAVTLRRWGVGALERCEATFGGRGPTRAVGGVSRVSP